MSMDTLMIVNPSTTHGQISSSPKHTHDDYSSYDTQSSSQSSASSNTDTPNRSPKRRQSNSRKESSLKLPYPVLSDHRDPSSVLILLQQETQTTSKKIADVVKQIEDCEKRLTRNTLTDNEKKTFKYERVKFKQQLDALKKHERRVSLQIDFMTAKTEIKGLEEEQKQAATDVTSDEYQQIKGLLGKLKQKLDKMKIYMRTRNEQMKKLTHGKQPSTSLNGNRKTSAGSSQKHQPFNSSTAKESNQKRPPLSGNQLHSNKRIKPTASIVRLTSRATDHESIRAPIVRFVTKTTGSTRNSASPTSSSSTLSPPLIPRTSNGNENKRTTSSLLENEIPSVDDDDELNLELNIDELFNDDTFVTQTVKRLKTEMKNITRQF